VLALHAATSLAPCATDIGSPAPLVSCKPYAAGCLSSTLTRALAHELQPVMQDAVACVVLESANRCIRVGA